MEVTKFEALMIQIENLLKDKEKNAKELDTLVNKLQSQQIYFSQRDCNEINSKLKDKKYSYKEYKNLKNLLQEIKIYRKENKIIEEVISGNYNKQKIKKRVYTRRSIKGIAFGLIAVISFNSLLCGFKENKNNKNNVEITMDNNYFDYENQSKNYNFIIKDTNKSEQKENNQTSDIEKPEKEIIPKSVIEPEKEVVNNNDKVSKEKTDDKVSDNKNSDTNSNEIKNNVSKQITPEYEKSKPENKNNAKVEVAADNSITNNTKIIDDIEFISDEKDTIIHESTKKEEIKKEEIDKPKEENQSEIILPPLDRVEENDLDITVYDVKGNFYNSDYNDSLVEKNIEIDTRLVEEVKYESDIIINEESEFILPDLKNVDEDDKDIIEYDIVSGKKLVLK